MIILCPLHGSNKGVLVSPDTLSSPDNHPPTKQIVSLTYTYLGNVAEAYYVSQEFADEHALSKTTQPLPDQYPAWTRKLLPCCASCFKSAHNGFFDDHHRWQSA